MCTLTFIPREGGFLVGMNRDERFSRHSALPPHVFDLDNGKAIYAFEQGGGTWIAVTDTGSAFALLNWATATNIRQHHSRGRIIPRVLDSSSPHVVHELLTKSDLSKTLPFRLIGIFPLTSEVREWRWHDAGLVELSYPWQRRHWFSSGLSDEKASVERGQICEAAWRQPSAGSEAWLRELHRSHTPEAGAFSVCVHRDDAATQSYTEIAVGPSEVTLAYAGDSPCRRTSFDALIALPRRTRATLLSFPST